MATRRDVVTTVIVAGLGLVTLAATIGGLTPAPLLVVVGAAAVLALGQTMSWGLAIACGGVGLLALLAIGNQVYPHLGLSLLVGNLALLTAVIIASLVVLALRDGIRLPGRAGAAFAASTLVSPAAALLAAWVALSAGRMDKFAWLMRNDSAWNLMSTRFIVEDGGVDPSKHGNVAPLTFEYVALFLAPGRSDVAPSELLAHDLGRLAQGLLLLVAVISVLGSVVVASVVPARLPLLRATLAVGAGLLPWTWYVAGFAWLYGFWNALLSLVVLMLLWLLWVSSRQQPIVASAFIALGGVVTLATWAPLTIVPAALGVALVVSGLRAHVAMRGTVLVAWALGIITFLGYAVMVTLPTTRGQSGALSLDGAFLSLGWAVPIVVAVIVWALSLLVVLLGGGSRDLAGLAALTTAGVIGVGYLVSQRADSATGPWGYYPAKFAWLLCLVMPFIAARAVAALAGVTVLPKDRLRLQLLQGGYVLASALAAVAVLAQVPPADLRPPSSLGNPAPRPAPDWRPVSMFPLWSLAQRDGISDFDGAVQDLFAASDPRSKVVFARYFRDPSRDGFVNFWLLQQPAESDQQMPRPYAYSLDSRNPAALCELVNAWGGGVRVVTRSPGLERKMQAACPQLDFEVDLEGRRGIQAS